MEKNAAEEMEKADEEMKKGLEQMEKTSTKACFRCPRWTHPRCPRCQSKTPRASVIAIGPGYCSQSGEKSRPRLGR